MYNALIDKSALYENVMIKSNGDVDFLDESLTANGRAVIARRKLKVRIKGKMVGIYSKPINLPPLENLDGLIFAFITRRNTIMPFAQELTPEQATLAYLWGESTHSFASQPLKAGESVRIVGTDPFIVGSRGAKVNRFYEIIMTLAANYPDKVKFLQYNTGGMGEIIEDYEEAGRTKKRMIRKVNRVPISLMAQIQRGDLRGANRYEKGRLGTKEITHVEGRELQEWDIKKYYSEEQIQYYVHDLVEGRREFTEEISQEGLRSEILNAAERSFRIDSPGEKTSVQVPGAADKDETGDKEELIAPVKYNWETKSRPRREGIYSRK